MSNFFSSLSAVLHEIENYHDSFTKVHEQRVGELMAILGKELNLDSTFCNQLKETGSLHDIGKLAIPPEIIEKAGPLSAFEKETFKLHSQIGHSFMQKVEHPLAELASTITLTHHESYDGSGYPYGLKGENIPLSGRICCVCDVYDALRAYRPYHCGGEKSSHEEVLSIMKDKSPKGLGYRFDPFLLEAFIEAKEFYLPLYQS